jgi:hypothetical protein
MNWLGQVHLYIQYPLKNPIVAIDLGVHTFGTLFDPTNQQYIEWGQNDMGRIYRLFDHIDKLQARIYKYNRFFFTSDGT